MRNQEEWKPSKCIYKKGKLVASRDSREVYIGSRLSADLCARIFDRIMWQHAKGRLLDLGCGKAPLYASYRDFVTDVICVDWVNTLHKNEYVDNEFDLTTGLPFGDSEFDTILLTDVLEHIPLPEQLWREMARILSWNGKIIVTVPFCYRLHETPNDYYRYTEFALRRFVETSGLRLIQLEPIGGAPEVMADIFAKNILSLPKLGRPIAVAAQSLTLALTRTKFGKKMSEATSSSYPLGYLVVAEKSRWPSSTPADLAP